VLETGIFSYNASNCYTEVQDLIYILDKLSPQKIQIFLVALFVAYFGGAKPRIKPGQLYSHL